MAAAAAGATAHRCSRDHDHAVPLDGLSEDPSNLRGVGGARENLLDVHVVAPFLSADASIPGRA
jgi:hypothetical protein